MRRLWTWGLASVRYLVPTVLMCGAVAGTAEAQVGASVTIVDANIATEQELSVLPQLTPTLVTSIVGGVGAETVFNDLYPRLAGR